MGDAERRGAGDSVSQEATRLQRRAPSSIQISRPASWNVAIPLLSPLVSPCLEQVDVLMGENKAREDARSRDKPATFTKWKHPAAPFCYGPVQRTTPFVPV